MEALRDLQHLLEPPAVTHQTKAGSEGDAQNRIRCEASKAGFILFRNNVGAGKLDGERFVRFGLANESKAQNTRCKSGDLIGLTPTGQFISIECKEPGWKYRGTEREMAQLMWQQLVITHGGIACFATCWQDVLEKLKT
jgi:hypothetical protein